MASNTTNSGELIAEQVSKILTQPLEQASVFLSSGVKIFDTAEPLRVPSFPASNADDLTFVAEAGEIPEQDYETTEVTLMPSGMRSVKVITRFTNELARQSTVSIDSVLQQRLVTDVAARVDAQLLSDTGDGVTTPQGMFAWAGTQELPTDAALSVDTLLDAYALALDGYVNVEAMKLFVRPSDYMVLRKLKDNDGRYLLQPDVSGGKIIVPALGAELKLSSRIPAGSAALADMSQVAVARDAAPSIKVLDQLYGATDEQGIRVVSRFDAKPLNPAAVVKITGITGA